MATRMRLYCVVIVQQSIANEITVTRRKTYGRSEYEAIGYVLKHSIHYTDGYIVDVGAVSCWNKPELGDNRKAIRESE